MPVSKQPPVAFACKYGRDPECPVLRREASDLDIGTFNGDKNDHVRCRVRLHDLLTEAAVPEKAAHSRDALWRIIRITRRLSAEWRHQHKVLGHGRKLLPGHDVTPHQRR